MTRIVVVGVARAVKRSHSPMFGGLQNRLPSRRVRVQLAGRRSPKLLPTPRAWRKDRRSASLGATSLNRASDSSVSLSTPRGHRRSIRLHCPLLGPCCSDTRSSLIMMALTCVTTKHAARTVGVGRILLTLVLHRGRAPAPHSSRVRGACASAGTTFSARGHGRRGRAQTHPGTGMVACGNPGTACRVQTLRD